MTAAIRECWKTTDLEGRAVVASRRRRAARRGALIAAPLVIAGGLVLASLDDPLLAQAGAADARVAAGKAIWETKCLACHTIGEGKRVGPDLKGVTALRDHDWLVRWIDDPLGMLQTDDLAKKLLAENSGVPMSDPGLDRGQAEQVLAYIESASGTPGAARPAEKPLTADEFEQAKRLYFDRCSGCHGVLRTGATGPNIEPARTSQIGTQGVKLALTNGLPGGMPAWGRLGVLTDYQIDMIARYVQMPPPEPPERGLDVIRASWKLLVGPDDRPKFPEHDNDWENYFGIILRDVGQVAIVDGDTKELRGVVDTGFAVHILRSSSGGRYFYAVGRDGRVSMIDLWSATPTLVAQVQGCNDARSVDASKYDGFEDEFVIEGCYWPPQYVVLDGRTLEPLQVTDVRMSTYDTNEPLKEVRVASIIASHHDPLWIISLKESGFVGLVDYSKKGFPMVAKIPSERFLHDGGWDHDKRYFMVAANMRNQMCVIDVPNKKFVAKFETGIKPHPGRGANWLDPEYGWVNGTVHIGEGRLAVFGADPDEHPEHAWKVVRDVRLPSSGSLFLKTHPSSPWVWMDSPLAADPAMSAQVCVYSKEKGDLYRCFKVAEHGRVVHFEYDKGGDELWASVWDKVGEIVIYDDKTLTEKQRLRGGWCVTPTGKFNVLNTAHDIY
jgi:nitrite reductase (NO-forming)/hydroxylamine reductase